MNAPNSQNVRIRLEIDVPTGVPGAVPAIAMFNEDGPPIKRYSSTIPPAGGLVCVRPVSGSLLGTFTFSVTYLSPYPVDVRVLGYPDSIYPGFVSTSPCPGGVIPGKKVAIGTWEWNDTHGNRVAGADHNSAGVLNKATIWKDHGGGLAFDGAVTLLGVTEGQGSCANSMMGEMEELASAEVFLISIRDGKFAGRHPAKRHSPREWIADVGREQWRVRLETSGNLTIRTGRQTISSQALSSNPFMATFPGEAFGAKADIVVTIP